VGHECSEAWRGAIYDRPAAMRITLRKESAKVKESKSERVEIGKLKLENG